MAASLNSRDLLMCQTCGTQFDVPANTPLSGCKVCDDPRQYVPPTGQKWTSMRAQLGKHQNSWSLLPIRLNSDSAREQAAAADEDSTVVPENRQIYSIETKPSLGIGERCMLIKTPRGNVLWDLIAYLDQETIDWIKSQGGLVAIVISHPHYYTTHLDWAEVFDCPVYIAAEDEEWVSREDVHNRRRLLKNTTEEIVPGMTAIKVGGHFPGSLVLHWDEALYVADSLVTVPSALYHINRPKDTISFTFMYSIPNMIPLSPDVILQMWKAIKPFDFVESHGAFPGQDIRDPRVKQRILESMKIQVAYSTGRHDHDLFHE